MTLKVAVHGAAGRMGRVVVDLVLQDASAELVAAIDQPSSPALGQDAGMLAGSLKKVGVVVSDDLDASLSAAQVVIDFSTLGSARTLVAACTKHKVSAVLGTTGLDASDERALDKLAESVPVVWAPNFSVGVNALVYLAARAVELVGPEFDIEIVEMHHRNKVDAPSGTAIRLTQAVSKVRGANKPQAVVHGRTGEVGVRTPEEIGVLALRGGDVVGEHTLVLAGPGERLELTHRAHSRIIFARGALRAAHWLAGKKPGRYDMADVLNIPK
jgi:4-hydroxy-tetrahydrodipicolinate reductase